MANIRERNGSYQISVYVGEDLKGNKLFERTTFRPTQTTPKAIKNEVNDFAREFEKRVKEGKYLTGDKLTLSRFVDIWETEWAVKNLTVVGVENYKSFLNGHILPELGGLKLSKITALHIQSVYDKLEKQGLAPATIKKGNTAINSVFKYAYRMGVISENPCNRIELPKMKKNTDLHVWTVPQAKKFLNVLQKDYTVNISSSDRKIQNTGTEFTVKEYKTSKRDRYQFQVLFSLAIFGGFRRGELVALKWSDIDFENKTVTICKAFAKTKTKGQLLKSPKTVSGNRTVVLPSNCFDLLSKWKTEQRRLALVLGSKWEGKRGKDFDDNFIFIQIDSGLPMNLDTPYHKFKEVIERYNSSCENEEDKLPEIRLHDLRHVSASLLLSENVDIVTVSRRLGHSQVSTTLDVYAHAFEKKDVTASNTLERLFMNA